MILHSSEASEGVSETVRAEVRTKWEVGPRREAGKAGLSPHTTSPSPIATRLAVAWGQRDIRGALPAYPGRVLCPLSLDSPHSALHRTHRPNGSLRGGTPRPAAPLQQPIPRHVLRPVSILRNAPRFPHPSVFFFPYFLCSLTHTPGCSR